MGTKFNVGNILPAKSYRMGEILKSHELNRRSIMDFLEVNMVVKEDRKILDSWMSDFKSRDIPFLLTQYGPHVTLWKRRLI